MSLIAWYVLLAHLMYGSTDPVGGVSATVTEYVLEGFVFGAHCLQRAILIEICPGGRWHGVGGVAECVNYLSVDFTGSHAELVDLHWDVTCVTWHVLFVKVHLALSWTQ